MIGERLGRLFRSGAPRAIADDGSIGTVELRAGGSRVAIMPALGGKIGVMELGGRDWLWKNDAIAVRRPSERSTYAETGDAGGYDECFPTVAPCTIPASVARYAGTALPDHGELWSQATTISVETKGGPPSATCEWQGRQLPYHFERTVIVESDGAVRMRYRVTNGGSARLPFIWAAHPVMALTPDTRIVLPDTARVRVWSQEHIDLFGPGAEHHWPRLRLKDGGETNMSRPASVAKRYACKLFVEMTSAHVGIRQEGAELECTWEAGDVSHLGVWLDRRGALSTRAGRGHSSMTIGPCIGAPDSLAAALGDWDAARWLDVGASREWELVWRARRAPTETPI